MTIEEIKNYIQSQLYERLASPYFSTLVGSWIFWNHKYLLLYFSSLEATAKIKLMEDFYPSAFCSFSHFILLPALSALLFLVIYPAPSGAAYFIWVRYQRFLQEQKQSLTNEKLLSLEDSRRIRTEIIELENRYDATLKSREAMIESLREKIVDLGEASKQEARPEDKASTPNDIFSEMKQLPKEDRDCAETVIQVLRDLHPHPQTVAKIRFNLPDDYIDVLDSATIDHILNQLTRIGATQSSGFGHKLTPEGVEYAVSNLAT